MIRFRLHTQRHADTQTNECECECGHTIPVLCIFQRGEHSFKLKAAYQPIKLINYFTDQILFIYIIRFRAEWPCALLLFSVSVRAWSMPLLCLYGHFAWLNNNSNQNAMYIRYNRTNQPASETAFVMDTPTVITLSSALNTI